MKGCNISDSTKILIFAATVIITCMLVSFGFRAAQTAAGISNHAILQMSELNDDLRDSNLMQYHDAEVRGSDVANCIKKHLGDYGLNETASIYIDVKTKTSENRYQNGIYQSDIKNFTNIKYIKPTAVFQGQVIKNENKVIVGISFIQQ